MLPTNSTDENWLLLQTRYDWLALPISQAMEVLKSMKLVSKTGSKLEMANGEFNMQIVSGEQMAVALVKAKILPGDKEA